MIKRVGIHSVGLLFLICISVGSAWTQGVRGFYLSHDIGLNEAPKVVLRGTTSDRASVCDEFINPLYAAVGGCTSLNRGAGDGWSTAFKRARGILSGAAVGYRFTDRIRVEERYSYRESAYDQNVAVTGVDGVLFAKLGGEIEVASESISSVTSHALFSNVYFDFPNDASRFTPYVGVGIGFGFTNVDYGTLWARTTDPNEITTASGLPNEADIQRNLAATTTSEREKLRDTLVGYQVLFGAEFALTDRVSLGAQGRWVRFGSFSADGGGWDRLRSHVSNLRLDGSEPATYRIRTDDTGLLGASVSIKYFF